MIATSLRWGPSLLTLAALGAAAPLAGGCSALVAFDECTIASDCPTGYRCADTTCVLDDGGDPTRVVVQGELDADVTWDDETIWQVKGTLFVNAGATLTITAGTRVEFEAGAAIIVDRGARIDAVGTELDPIVLTSVNAVGERAAGDWGGLVLLGSAPTSFGTDVSFTALEAIGRSSYGGNDAEYSCGAVEYVRIEFGGVSKDAGREIPAFAMAGCGSQTKVDHVQVHRARDEAFEVLGGTVSFSHILVTYAGEVGFEYKKGWAGVAQFIMIHQGDQGLYGIIGEEGGLVSNERAGERAHIANFTVLADPVAPGQIGVLLKEGARGELFNGLVGGQTFHAVNIASSTDEATEDTVAQAEAGELAIVSTVFFRPTDAGPLFPDADETGAADDDGGMNEDEFFRDAELKNVFDRDPQMSVSIGATTWVPGNSALREGATDLTAPYTPGTSYYGAFKVGVKPWTDGWTDLPAN